jgi:hypothetical protein
MTILTAIAPSVNTDLDTDLSETFTPDAADESWVAETLNTDADDYDVEPDALDYDAMAAEAAFLDAHELGLLSLGLADYISRTSLVGHPA